MFYISKILSNDKFVVNDTEDRSAEEVSLSDLQELDKLGVKVYGYSEKGIDSFRSDDAVLSKYKTITRLSGLPFELSVGKTGLRLSELMGSCSLSSLKIPDYITEIALHQSHLMFCDAFKNLKAVRASRYLRSLGTKAFKKCTSLESVDFPGVIDVWSDCFMGCGSLRDANLGKLVEFIGSEAFSGCCDMKVLTIDSSNLHEIGWGAFRRSGLSYVDFSKCSLKVVDSECFRGCSSLHTVLLPSTCEEICESCFDGCTSLKEITMPSNLVHLGKSAFEASGLTRIDLRSCTSLESITTHVFRCCEELVGVKLPLNCTRIGFEAFKSCKKLRTVSGITRDTFVATGAFAGCTNLKRRR